MMEVNGYCELYIDTTMPRSELNDLVQEMTGGQVGTYCVDCGWGELEIRENDEYSRLKKHRPDDGFLYFRYIADVEPKKLDQTVYVEGLRKLVNSLRARDIGVVPACDFEDELNS